MSGPGLHVRPSPLVRARPLQGRVVVVTGAARGVGAAAASALAARGARVALIGPEAGRLEAVAQELPDAATFATDVRDAAALREAFERIAATTGGIDAVVVYAGFSTGGAYRTVRACLPHVIERRGYVLQVASPGTALPAPLSAAYAASKARLESLAQALRREVRPHGVEVGLLYPAGRDRALDDVGERIADAVVRRRARSALASRFRLVVERARRAATAVATAGPARIRMGSPSPGGSRSTM